MARKSYIALCEKQFKPAIHGPSTDNSILQVYESKLFAAGGQDRIFATLGNVKEVAARGKFLPARQVAIFFTAVSQS